MVEESTATDEETPLEQIAAGITIGAILALAFGLLAVGYPWFWVVFPVGFAGVLPAVIGLVKLYERRSADAEPRAREAADGEDALETIRERYARGELSDAEFDRRLDRLLETESPEGVAAATARGGDREEYDLERT